MTTDEKLTLLKALLGISTTDQDTLLTAYLTASEKEILQWKYSLLGADSVPSSVDDEDEMTQIHAVIAGFNLQGVENQYNHTENGITRNFHYTDMVQYIRSNVIPYARIAGYESIGTE